jgi:hypothetical protein
LFPFRHWFKLRRNRISPAVPTLQSEMGQGQNSLRTERS